MVKIDYFAVERHAADNPLPLAVPRGENPPPTGFFPPAEHSCPSHNLAKPPRDCRRPTASWPPGCGKSSLRTRVDFLHWNVFLAAPPSLAPSLFCTPSLAAQTAAFFTAYADFTFYPDGGSTPFSWRGPAFSRFAQA